jgi:uncharacterized protein (TIGR01777 family)
MRVFITGGTGLIGRHLVRRLVERGDEPIILSRRADEVRRDPSLRSLRIVQGDPTVADGWTAALDGTDAVVNLVGHNIFGDRWNAQVKRKIRDSRVYGTENLVAAIAKAKNPPRVLAQGSAVGYYGIRDDEELTEDGPSGSDFMAVVCREWEEAAHPAETLGVRVARVRTGIVLARGEGALGVMTPLFKFGLGAPIGGSGSLLAPGLGKQWMSWIHIDDIVGLYLFALDKPEVQGPINGTAPHPVRNAEFAKILARVLWRFALPIGPPELLLKVILGDVAHVITTGQKVLPAKALALGYSFRYPDLEGALRAIFAEAPAPARPERVAAAAGHHHGHGH